MEAGQGRRGRGEERYWECHGDVEKKKAEVAVIIEAANVCVCVFVC